jgi:hypothetical protein
MELIWSNDGVSTEEERKNNGVSCKDYPLFLGLKSGKREKKNPTPPRNLQSN